MPDLIFKKKDQKPVFDKKQCIAWEDVDGNEHKTDLRVTFDDLLKMRKMKENTTYEKQMEYIKTHFFKLDFEVSEGQLFEQFMDVSAHLEKVLEEKFPSK